MLLELWVKAKVLLHFLEKKYSKKFLCDVNRTLFLRNDDRRVVECVWNELQTIRRIIN